MLEAFAVGNFSWGAPLVNFWCDFNAGGATRFKTELCQWLYILIFPAVILKLRDWGSLMALMISALFAFLLRA